MNAFIVTSSISDQSFVAESLTTHTGSMLFFSVLNLLWFNTITIIKT